MISPALDAETKKQARLLLARGEKIKAILIVRRSLGIGLREGKKLVEGLAAYSRAETTAMDIEAEIRADERAKARDEIARECEANAVRVRATKGPRWVFVAAAMDFVAGKIRSGEWGKL